MSIHQKAYRFDGGPLDGMLFTVEGELPQRITVELASGAVINYEWNPTLRTYMPDN